MEDWLLAQQYAELKKNSPFGVKMLIDVIGVDLVRDYTLYLKFEDGLEGEIDISTIIPFKGIFSNLENKDFFKSATLNRELGTVVWNNGADIAPSYLYEMISKKRPD